MGLLMIVTVASAERIIVDYAVVIVPPGEYLRGRITPINGDTMMRLYLGDVVDIVDRIDGWVEIVGGENGTCWVCEEYLVATYQPLETPVDAVIRSNGRVRLRKHPDGDMLCWMKNGSQLDVIAYATVDNTEWCMTDKGWIMSEFVEVLPNAE